MLLGRRGLETFSIVTWTEDVIACHKRLVVNSKPFYPNSLLFLSLLGEQRVCHSRCFLNVLFAIFGAKKFSREKTRFLAVLQLLLPLETLARL